MAEKVKILVAGIGGVGGYFGGLLARKFENSEEVNIAFLARGEHLAKIRASGLKVI
jgi:2-dehydropantoate 2-reductase